MKLSETLSKLHESSDFGSGLEGISELVERMEVELWLKYHDESARCGADSEFSKAYADERMTEFKLKR